MARLTQVSDFSESLTFAGDESVSVEQRFHKTPRHPVDEEKLRRARGRGQ